MSQAAQSSEPYYENEEIEVLHEIITEAQTAIDGAKEPKPLPVQALFKAYDRILPRHGIDPDSDQHLSTFIFRVGGERGDVSLLEKFHTILDRMGIELKFGDDDTASAVSAHSRIASEPSIAHPGEAKASSSVGESAFLFANARSLDNHLSTSGRNAEAKGSSPQTRQTALSKVFNRWSIVGTEEGANGHRLVPYGATRASSEEQSALLAWSDDGKNDVHRTTKVSSRGAPGLAEHVLEEDQAPVAPRPSILTLLDRWSIAASRRQISQQTQDAISSQTPEPSSIRDLRQSHIRDSRESTAVPFGIVEDGQITHPSARGDITRIVEPTKRQSPSPDSDMRMLLPPQKSLDHRPEQRSMPETPYQQQALVVRQSSASGLEDERLLQLARRAREIYVASKAFNHWADKTARRLEREAVARRHMIRFKCFRGWCQGPGSQDDEAHRLRASTAVEKLRRAVAEHEEQLRLAALAASHSRRIKTVLGALDKWMRHKAENEARQKTVWRSRVKATTGWLVKANGHRGMEEHASERYRLYSETQFVACWCHQADIGAMRDTAAKKINEHRISFAHLAQWWDQAELQQRAHTYHRGTLLERARHYFEQWNLQARRQAFIWRSEYLSVRKIFEVWQRSAQEDHRIHTWANRMSETRRKIRYSRIISDVDTQRQRLERLSSRACLYILGTRILTVFEQSVEQKQARRWEAVKRHLAGRYEQVSTARKRRMFFATLDTWRIAASVSQDQADQARHIHKARRTTARTHALSSWLDESMRSERRHYEAQLYHTLPTLAMWHLWSQDQEEMNLQALDMIRTGSRIQYQKMWSISSLQHGGLAHTASMVAQRYQREQRNRTLHYWREHTGKGEYLAVVPLSQRRGRLGAYESSKSAFRLPSQRKLAFRGGSDGHRQSTGTFETPTRWTGQPFPMGSLFVNRPMPPVREADEDHSPTSSRLEDEDATRSPQRPMRSVKITTAPRPSTTPRAPVPVHVEEEFRAQFRPATSIISGSSARLTTQEKFAGASQPSRQDLRTWVGGRHLDGSISAPPANHSQSQPALARPTTTWSGRPASSRLRISRLAKTARPAQRQASTPSVIGTIKTPSKSSIFSGTGQSEKWGLSKSFNSRLQ